ncbi:MAG: hypothetical protein VX893_08125 [Candidatus Latescibacterota bacterium]|nr:hypothetical protein [Candidatus Latescibacterota bacterium]
MSTSRGLQHVVIGRLLVFLAVSCIFSLQSVSTRFTTAHVIATVSFFGEDVEEIEGERVHVERAEI